jgi:uncharacterized protein (DUF1697 family)
MRSLALLRGINVGGHHKIEMQRLRSLCERHGLRDVRTYIASGNVIFDHDGDTDDAGRSIEELILAEFGFSIPVLVKEAAALTSIADAMARWVDDAAMRCYVMFLWPAVDTPATLEHVTVRKGIDDVTYVPGAIIWRVDRSHLARSGMQQVARSELYRSMTVRNSTTTRKLAELVRTDSGKRARSPSIVSVRSRRDALRVTTRAGAAPPGPASWWRRAGRQR